MPYTLRSPLRRLPPFALLWSVLFAGMVLAAPPPALQDSGDCGIDKSQAATMTKDGKSYTARSFFEPASRTRVGGITKEDLDALVVEVERLKANPCYEVCVRSLVTANGFAQACANCDFVYILAHGSAKAPYVSMGGAASQDLQQWPGTVNAGSVWIGGCHGQEAASQLNGATGTRYRSLPGSKFDKQGCVLRKDMVQGLTAELKTLTDMPPCYYQPKKVCILAAVQEVVVAP